MRPPLSGVLPLLNSLRRERLKNSDTPSLERRLGGQPDTRLIYELQVNGVGTFRRVP
jgi:hypothetical protein